MASHSNTVLGTVRIKTVRNYIKEKEQNTSLFMFEATRQVQNLEDIDFIMWQA
jgi:hypothetical protein